MLSSTDVLFSECPWSLDTRIPDPISATPVYVENSGDCDGLMGCCVSCSLWSSFCHPTEHPFGLVSARSAFPHPGASSRMSLDFFCATLLPTFVTWCPCYHFVQQGLQRDCAFCSRGDSNTLHFYPECCSHRSLSTGRRKVQGGKTGPYTLCHAVIICSRTVE